MPDSCWRCLARQARVRPGTEPCPARSCSRRRWSSCARNFDPRWGGFGPAPKFPQAMAVELILRPGRPGGPGHGRSAPWTPWPKAACSTTWAAASPATAWTRSGWSRTSRRCSTTTPSWPPATWAPSRPPASARYAAVARETLDYLLRDLRDPAGGFHSSEDADSEGDEGRFYVFTPAEVEAALGAADGARFCRAYGVTAEGNFEHGASVLHRFAAPDADLRGMDDLRARLRARRDARVRPGKDDKVLAAWNGLALGALARGFQVLGEARYLEAALALAGFLKREMGPGRALLRSWRQGRGAVDGFLEDYGAVACGLVDLYEACFDPAWLRWAEELAGTMRGRFEDPGQGFFGSPDTPDLLFRQKPFYDGALPSGNTLAARALLRLDGHLERPGFRDSAEGILRCAAPLMRQAPTGFLGMLSALDLAQAPMSVAITGDPRDPATRALLAAARRPYRPTLALTLVAADPDLPLHRDRGPAGRPAAFLCRGRACAPPETDPAALERALRA